MDWDNLFLTYHQRLVRWATRQLGNADIAEEAVAEMWLRVVQEQKEEIEDPKNWLFNELMWKISGERVRARERSLLLLRLRHDAAPLITRLSQEEFDEIVDRPRCQRNGCTNYCRRNDAYGSKYCSLECFYAARKEKGKKCARCGKYIRRRTYCSQQCYFAAKKK